MTKEKQVMISIHGYQTYEGAQDDSMSLLTEGTLTQTEDGYQLRYEETELTGMEGTTTIFQIQGPRVTLVRMGSVCSQMVFEEGRRHHSLYSTPYGNLEVGVSTTRLQSTLDARGGRLEIDYSIEIDHALAGCNAFRISVREAHSPVSQ